LARQNRAAPRADKITARANAAQYAQKQIRGLQNQAAAFKSGKL